MKRLALVAALWVSAAVSRAAAETNADVVPRDPDPVPVARPVIPIEDTRSHGPTARNFVDVSVAPTLLVGAEASVLELTAQLAAGLPAPARRELREIYDAFHLTDYELRIRNEVFFGGGSASGGPMTFALQRYVAVAPLAISPLLYAHFGVEAALATPWLSGRSVTPPRTVAVLDGVDSELAGSGWSVRPLSGYLRGDFLVCRSASAEVGFEPEAFVPAVGPNQYGTRFHAAAGVSLGCKGNLDRRALKLAVEYRGRVTMYAAGEPPSYRDSIGVAAQIDVEWFVVQVFYRADPGAAMRDYGAIGARLQIGWGRE